MNPASRTMGAPKIGGDVVQLFVKTKDMRGRNYIHLGALSLLILLILIYIDPRIQNDLAWILGGLGVGLALLESAPVNQHIELIVALSPLGVQRITKINDRVTYHPLLPRACINDCIIVEHVGVFDVTTNLVFRVESTLVSAFPNVRLKFHECESLLKNIRGALRRQ